MKLQNIFALIVTLIGFAACTSESELPDTLVNGDLVPVTISLGSMQTKASVGLDGDEGAIQNAVIAIFDSKGIPTIAPIVLKGQNSGTTRLPLVKSNAYAFVNVSDEDIAALEACGSEDAFKGYAIKKELTQEASDLPKFGKKVNFTPTDGGTFEIPVNQLTARVEAMVDIKVFQDGQEISNSDLSVSKYSLLWKDMSFNSSSKTQTIGNNDEFTTTIDGKEYKTLNRAYTYSGVKPTIELSGTIIGEKDGFDGMSSSFTYTFKEDVKADNVYIVRFIAKVDITDKVNPTLTYEVVNEAPINVDIPSFE